MLVLIQSKQITIWNLITKSGNGSFVPRNLIGFLTLMSNPIIILYLELCRPTCGQVSVLALSGGQSRLFLIFWLIVGACVTVTNQNTRSFVRVPSALFLALVTQPTCIKVLALAWDLVSRGHSRHVLEDNRQHRIDLGIGLLSMLAWQLSHSRYNLLQSLLRFLCDRKCKNAIL